MTQDEIIAMATQVYGECNWHKSALLRLEAFVKLVEDKAFQDGYEKGVAAFNEAVELEREACAKACENMTLEWKNQPHIAKVELSTMMDCALAIRTRGEA
jgi:hypothetical protein